MKSFKFYAVLSLLSVVIVFPSTAYSETANVVLKGTSNNNPIEGNLLLEEVDQGLSITGTIRNAPPGKHGFHIHQFGSCADMGKAAGGHFNPDASDHGHAVEGNVYEAHPGDMGNVEVGSDGTAEISLFVEDLGLMEGVYNVAGRAFILHEKEDDFGQPTGNAGGRIACGSILISG